MVPTALSERRLRAFVVCILLAAYLLVYVNTPDSADGEALLAVATSLVRGGTTDIGALGLMDSQFEHDMSRMGVFGLDGALYSKKGITPSLVLVPFVALAQLAPWLTAQATAMLLNPLVTALAGGILYTLVRRLGFRSRTAVITALAYGWGTTAIVYTRTLFGEPLAAFLLVAAVDSLVRWQNTRRVNLLLLTGAAAGLCIGINLTYLGAAALFALAIAVETLRRSRMSLRSLLAPAAAYAVPVLLCVVGIGLYNLARFGSFTTSGYYLGSGEGFNRPFLLGLFGLTFSPYRGLFWYSPILLLALPGAWLLVRRHHPRGPALLILGLVVAQFASYASWWSWHGGVVWGPRFLVPILPLLAVCIAPMVDAAVERPPLRAPLVLLGGLSLAVQLLGVVLSPYPFYSVLSGRYGTGDMSALVATLRDEVLYDVQANAILGHIDLLQRGQPVDLTWLGENGWIILVCAIAMAAAAVIHLGSSTSRRSASAAWVLVAVGLIGAADSQTTSKSALVAQQLDGALANGVPALIASAYYQAGMLDIEARRVVSMNAPSQPDDSDAGGLWRFSRDTFPQLWYVTWFGPHDPANWVERMLFAEASFAGERSVDGHRALWFAFDPPPAVQTGGWQFGPIVLERYTVQTRNEDLFVTLEWQASAPPLGDYTWFVHLLDESGAVIAQQDRAPQGGYMPSSTWRPGTALRDALYFPGVRSPAALRVGWIDPATGERLPAASASGAPLADDFALIELTND